MTAKVVSDLRCDVGGLRFAGGHLECEDNTEYWGKEWGGWGGGGAGHHCGTCYAMDT